MKLFFKILGVLAVFAVIAASAVGAWLYTEYKKPLGNNTQLLYIAPGDGVLVIAAQLQRQNIIDQIWKFKWAARATDRVRTLKAGEYEIPANVSIEGLLAIFQKGDRYKRSITFREGLTSWQVMQVLNDNEYLVQDYEGIPDEGSLLPETYVYYRGDKESVLITRMQSAMLKALDEAWESRAKNLPFDTKEEALIMASIIEKETGQPEERDAVAGVFTNRLEKGMRLQTDPTVIYALTGGKIQDEGKGPIGRRLLYRDLEVISPYNTYKNAGLTPGPICNPGKASLRAAVNPEQHEYIYFVADGTGGHAFAKTLDEHNTNVAQWRKVRDTQ